MNVFINKEKMVQSEIMKGKNTQKNICDVYGKTDFCDCGSHPKIGIFENRAKKATSKNFN